MTVPTILVTIGLANLIYDLTGFIIKCFNRTKREKDIEKIDMCNRSYVQALREMDDYATYITHKHDDQIVYKVDGDFNGDIKGDNVTVILMGDGDINGNIESKDGNVVLIKGNINGNVKANKVVCPTESATKAKCSDCVFAKNKHYISASGIFSEGYYDCSKFNKTVNEDCSACLEYKSKSKNKDVESPKLPVKTLWSCDIPQGTSPEKRIDHYTSIGNRVSIYGSSPVTHITCPHCKKHFATQLRVQTSVVDGDVVETRVEETKRDY